MQQHSLLMILLAVGACVALITAISLASLSVFNFIPWLYGEWVWWTETTWADNRTRDVLIWLGVHGTIFGFIVFRVAAWWQKRR